MKKLEATKKERGTPMQKIYIYYMSISLLTVGYLMSMEEADLSKTGFSASSNPVVNLSSNAPRAASDEPISQLGKPPAIPAASLRSSSSDKVSDLRPKGPAPRRWLPFTSSSGDLSGPMVAHKQVPSPNQSPARQRWQEEENWVRFYGPADKRTELPADIEAKLNELAKTCIKNDGLNPEEKKSIREHLSLIVAHSIDTRPQILVTCEDQNIEDNNYKTVPGVIFWDNKKTPAEQIRYSKEENIVLDTARTITKIVIDQNLVRVFISVKEHSELPTVRKVVETCQPAGRVEPEPSSLIPLTQSVMRETQPRIIQGDLFKRVSPVALVRESPGTEEICFELGNSLSNNFGSCYAVRQHKKSGLVELFVGCDHGDIQVFDLKTKELKKIFKGPKSAVQAIGFCYRKAPGEPQEAFVTRIADGSLWVWHTDDLRSRVIIKCPAAYSKIYLFNREIVFSHASRGYASILHSHYDKDATCHVPWSWIDPVILSPANLEEACHVQVLRIISLMKQTDPKNVATELANKLYHSAYLDCFGPKVKEAFQCELLNRAKVLGVTISEAKERKK